MVYKKYIWKNGKKYGPYLYETKRENGKIVTKYVGKGSAGKRAVNPIFFLLLGLILLGSIIVFFNPEIAGYVVENTQEALGSFESENTVLAEQEIKEPHDSGKVNEIEKEVRINEREDYDSETGVTIKTENLQYGAVLGRPVKWNKNVSLSRPSNVSIAVPKSASNISIESVVLSNLTSNETTINETDTNVTFSNDADFNVTKGNLTESDVSGNFSGNESVNEGSGNLTVDGNELEIGVVGGAGSGGASGSGNSKVKEDKGKDEVKFKISNVTIVDSDVNDAGNDGGSTEGKGESDKDNGVGKFDSEGIGEIVGDAQESFGDVEIASEDSSEDNSENQASEDSSDESGSDNSESSSDSDSDFEESDGGEVVVVGITGEVVRIVERERGFTSWIKGLLRDFRISGFVVAEDPDAQEVQLVEIEGEVREVEIGYETPVPYAEEQDLENGKRVRIVGPDDVHYENVLAFTELNESLGVRSRNGISLKWVENGTRIDYDLYDRDANGIYDYVEWIVPHLSNQTFDIIVITGALHLNSDRDFISDIYDDVKELDGNWSETIFDGDYVRVSFEKNLTPDRDITIYPRTINGTPRLDIYEINGTQKIAGFDSINDEELNKVYLDGSSGAGLQGEQDSFDLRVLGGSLEFDWIVDPLGGTNNWICSSLQEFSNASCWSLGSVPVSGENVVLNASGTGDVNVTNNTMPQDLSSFRVDSGYTGTVHYNALFAKGSWGSYGAIGSQEWNVTNNISVYGGTHKIYGSFVGNATDSSGYNISEEGEGQIWNGKNITLGQDAVLDGNGLGFPVSTGPGGGNDLAEGGVHATTGNYGSIHDIYGNASAPTSLGSGGGVPGQGEPGGSAIKLKGDSVVIEGNITMDGLGGVWGQGAGGSIWIKADNISGSGELSASTQKKNDNRGGGAGRIRLEYGSEMSYDGLIDLEYGGKEISDNDYQIGTLTFTNNTWPNDWTIDGYVGLLGGDYGEGEVVNVEGDFVVNGNLVVWGDCFFNITNSVTCYNKTANGRGVWINSSGNITISSGALVAGMAKGFPKRVGPGAGTWGGGSHGGEANGGGTHVTYGSALEPTSLGSGGSLGLGGSAVKFESLNKIVVDGDIRMDGDEHGNHRGGAGGSIWLMASKITGSGNLNSTGSFRGTDSAAGGGGGRITFTSSDYVNFTGNLDVRGQEDFGSDFDDHGGGGTIYINATNSISLSGNVLAIGGGDDVGNAGSGGGYINVTDSLLGLSGIFNASVYNISKGLVGNITFNYTDCSSTFTGTFDPNYIDNGPVCDTTSPEVVLVYPKNGSYVSEENVSFNATFSDDSELANSTFYLWNSTGDNINTTTTSITGTSNSTNLSVILPYEDTFEWNYLAYDGSGNGAWNDSNFTINYDETAPTGQYVGPTNDDGSFVSEDFIEINVSAEDNNLDTILIRLYNSTGDEINSSSGDMSPLYVNFSSLDGGLYYYNATINDSARNSNELSTRNVTLDNTSPGLAIDSPENITYSDSSLDINFTASDDNLDSCWYTDDFGVSNNTLSDCANSTYMASEGSTTLILYANDSAGNEGSDEVSFVVDTVAPSVTSLTENPLDPATYVFEQEYEFNSTVEDNNLDSVLFEFDGVNYTASGEGNIYNATIVDIGVGTYSYVWYANDTFGNVNVTESDYTVNNATGNISLLLNGLEENQTSVYGAFTNASASTLYGFVTIYRNGIDVSFENGDDVTLDAGDWNYTAVSSGNENHSSARIGRWGHIEKAVPSGSISGTASIDFGTSGDVEGSESNTGDGDVMYALYRNDALASNPDTTILGAGTYNYIYNATSGQNYTSNASMDTFVLTVSKIGGGLNLTLNNIEGNITLDQGDSIDLNATLVTGDSSGSIVLYKNGILINNGTSSIGNITIFSDVGVENITAIYEGSQNYSRSSETYWVTVNEVDSNPPEVTINVPENKTYGSSSITFNISLNENGSVVYSLDDGVNNVTMDTNDNREFEDTVAIADGGYVFSVYANDTFGNKNYTESVTFSVSVSVGGGSVGGGGGGGGSSSTAVTSKETSTGGISVEEDNLDVENFEGSSTKKTIRVKNEKNESVNISLSVLGLEGVRLPQDVVLGPGEERDLEIEFIQTGKRIRMGKIIISNKNGIIDEVDVTVNVKSKDFLFDASVFLPEEYKRVESGDVLRAQIDLNEVGVQVEKVDVVATYVIKDFSGNIYLEESETFFLLDRKFVVKEFSTSGLSPGKYILGVEIVYPGAFATTSSQFEIIGSLFEDRGIEDGGIWAFILITAVSAVFGAIVWIAVRPIRKRHKRTRKKRK